MNTGFKLEMTTDNAAFEDEGAEVARILRQVARYIEGGNLEGGRCMDFNGNNVGPWDFFGGRHGDE